MVFAMDKSKNHLNSLIWRYTFIWYISYINSVWIFIGYYCHDIQTEHRRGLKIHVGRKHQVSCKDCGINFKDKESFIRHNEGKSTLKNIEPCESPDDEMKIDTKEPDEACLAIYDKTANTVICLLHSHECWSRLAHSADDLPSQKEVLEDINKDILHQAIGSMVMGELSMMGYFMDWSSFAASIAQQKTT